MRWQHLLATDRRGREQPPSFLMCVTLQSMWRKALHAVARRKGPVKSFPSNDMGSGRTTPPCPPFMTVVGQEARIAYAK